MGEGAQKKGRGQEVGEELGRRSDWKRSQFAVGKRKNSADFESLALLLAREGGLRLYSRDFNRQEPGALAEELATGLTPR